MRLRLVHWVSPTLPFIHGVSFLLTSWLEFEIVKLWYSFSSHMKAWRATLAAQQQQMHEDDKQDDLDSFLDQVHYDLNPRPRSPTGGSRPGQRANVDREREEGHEQLFADYFSDNPIYGPSLF